MKTLGLVAAMFLGLAADPAGALAHGGRGGGQHGGGHPGSRGAGARGAGAWHHRPAPVPVVRYSVRPVAPVRAHVWVPGYWGARAGARVWVGGGWYVPPQAGWTWVGPQWTWTGHQWVWQEGRWAPPA